MVVPLTSTFAPINSPIESETLTVTVLPFWVTDSIFSPWPTVGSTEAKAGLKAIDRNPVVSNITLGLSKPKHNCLHVLLLFSIFLMVYY